MTPIEKALEDIIKHSVEPFAGKVQWSNYCKEVAEEALEALRESGWRDIESAPRDGKSILVYSPKYKEQFVVQWMICLDDDIGAWVLFRFDGQAIIIRDATHWMPLPEAPQPPKEK